MELIEYYIEDNKIELETIDNTFTTSKDVFFEWLEKKGYNAWEDENGGIHPFFDIAMYFEITNNKQLRSDLSEFLLEKFHKNNLSQIAKLITL